MVKPTIFTVSDEDAKKVEKEKAAEAGFVEVPVDTVECTVKDPNPTPSPDRRSRRACYIALGVVTTLLLIGAVVAIILVFVVKPDEHPENNGNDVIYPEDDRIFDWRGDAPFPPGHRPGHDHDGRPGRPGHDDDDHHGGDHDEPRRGHDNDGRQGHHNDDDKDDDDDIHHRRPTHRHDRPDEPDFDAHPAMP